MRIMEKRFRGAQICRVLSYPIAYAIAKILLERGRLSLDEIVKVVGRSKPAVCHHLAKLRLANIVRYDKDWRTTIYWIKYPAELKRVFKGCEDLVDRTTRRLKKDY
ncbi:MAG: ArsR family transcriptional regulator [candidate division WOR-3 bacterium]